MSFISTNGCRREVLWYDHAIWYILNHLPNFFLNEDSMHSTFMAFLIFLSSTKDTVMDQITFMYTCELLIKVSLEQHENPKGIFLSGYGVAEGILQVEQLIKPTTFIILRNQNQIGSLCQLLLMMSLFMSLKFGFLPNSHMEEWCFLGNCPHVNHDIFMYYMLIGLLGGFALENLSLVF